MTQRGERKITTFKWEKEGMEVEIPVWVVDRSKATRGTYYEDDKPTVYFKAELARDDFPRIHEEDANIEALRKKVFAGLDKWYNVDWDLYVMVSAHGSGSRSGFSANFGYEFYVVGKRMDGETVHMHVPEPWSDWGETPETWDGTWKGVRWSGRDPKKGLPDTGKITTGYLQPDETRALIPATKKNIDAVLRFQRLLKQLSEEMEHFFHPDRIEGVLKRILDMPRVPLLPEKTEVDSNL